MSELYYFTERQKEIAERTNLVELLRSQGETLKPSGTEWEWLCRGQKVTIRNNLWYHQYEQVGGDAVSFVRKFMGMSYVDAVEYLLQYNGEPLPERSRNEKKAFELPQANMNMNRVFAYPFLQSIIITASSERSTNKVRWVNDKGIPLQSISAKSLCDAIFTHLHWMRQYQFRFRGVSRVRDGVKFIVFSLDEPQILVGKGTPDIASGNANSSIRFIQYRDNGEAAACAEDGAAYPIEWQSRLGVPYAYRVKRDAVTDAVRRKDIYAPSVIVQDPALEEIPSQEELQDEFEYLLASM